MGEQPRVVPRACSPLSQWFFRSWSEVSCSGTQLEVRPESHWRPSAYPLSPQLASSIDAPEEPHPGRRGRFPAELLASKQRQPSAIETRQWMRSSSGG